MPTQYELESRWITDEGIPGVNYRFSDLVRIRAGDYEGQTAEVIALLSIDPEPKYGVILPPNEQFLMLSQQELEFTGRSTGRTLSLRRPGEKPA